jgi:mannosylglycerate hydrolase
MLETVRTQIPLYIYLHFHWDREWFLSFSTARALLLDRARKTLSALESGELPSFFLDGQAVVLEDLIEIEPSLLPRIQAAMSAGKLSAGPWYCLPDQSLVGGESLVRNLKLGIEITKRFGPPTMTGYNPDTFCHVQDLPRILQGFGITTALVLRGVPPLKDTNVFWWGSPDGSRVLTYLLNKGLTHPVFHRSADEHEIAKDLLTRWDLEAASEKSVPMLYSAGGEGMQPPGDLTRKLEKINGLLPENCQAKVVPIDSFLADLERWAQDKPLPVISGDLRDNRSISERFPAYILDGVTSTRLYLKRENALAEHRLIRIVEPLYAMLHAQGVMTYPGNDLTHVWKLLLQNHPHDSICGCSIDIVHEEMRTRTQQLNSFLDGLDLLVAENIADHENVSRSPAQKKKFILPSTTGLQPTDPDNAYDRLLIYNTSSLAQRAPVKVTWHVDPDKPLPEPLVQFQVETDTVHPNQLFHSGGGFYYRKVRRIDGWVWPDSEVPAIGFIESKWIAGDSEPRRAGSKTHGKPAEFANVSCAEKSGVGEIDNGLVQVKVDNSGNLLVKSIAHGAEKETTLGHDIYDVGDGGDSYNFDPLQDDVPLKAKFVSAKHRKQGPLVSSILLTYEIDIPEGLDTNVVTEEHFDKGRSKNLLKHVIQTEVTIKKGLPILFFDTTFENRSSDHRLSVRFKTSDKEKETFSESHFSIARQPQPAPTPALPVAVGYEIPPESNFCQRFFIVEGQIFFNRGLPEYRNASGYVEITLLRSVSWLSRGRLRTRGGGAGPWEPTPEANCYGLNHCEYAWAFLGESKGDELQDEKIIQAYELADDFEGRLVSFLIGKFVDARLEQIVSMSNPALYTTAIFIDHGKLCLRLLNVTSSPQKSTLKLSLPILSASKTNMLIDTLQNIPIKKDAAGAVTLSLDFKQNELLTIAFDLPQLP